MKTYLFPRQFLIVLTVIALSLQLLQCQSSRFLVKQNIPQTWQEHQQRMLAFEQWQLAGKIGITFPYEGKRKGVTARFDWEQRQSDYVMVLSGPMGVGRFTLEKAGKITEITNPRGEQFRARSPEELFYQHTGMHLPITDLAWWIRGIPVPDKMHQKTFHTENYRNQLASLEQSSWKIEYLDYQQVGSNFLPQKIKLSDGSMNVTLVINDWLIQRIVSRDDS